MMCANVGHIRQWIVVWLWFLFGGFALGRAVVLVILIEMLFDGGNGVQEFVLHKQQDETGPG
jgi:hypothetical protein